MPVFPGLDLTQRLLSTAASVNGEVVTADPTTLAANTALDDAKAMLAQAKEERDATEKKRDAAEKKWIDAGQPKDGYFQRQLADAQSAVADAQSTVNKLLNNLAGNGSSKEEWVRVEVMDSYPAELLKAHRAAKELEELEATSGGDLAPGTVSSCGSVEHLGAGVFLAPNTPPIDPDSATVSGQATLTRRETRFMAGAAVDAVFDVRSRRKVVVVGQPGTGKTRGGATATVQELLSRGYNVLRVGYKDDRVYLFKRDDHSGEYTAWEFTRGVSLWSSSSAAKNPDVVAVIDPPESSGNYSDRASCPIIKWASNNSRNHYHNINKDGMLLVTAMPTEAETAAATRVLWNSQTTPRPGDSSDPPLADKQEEVLRRATLVGHCWRQLFSWNDFTTHVGRIITEAKGVANTLTDAQLRMYYPGEVAAQPDGDTTNASSRLFILNPVQAANNPSADWVSRWNDQAVLPLNLVASAVISDRLTNIVKSWAGTTDSSRFEALCFGILRRGVHAEGLTVPASSPRHPATKDETCEALKTTDCDAGNIVWASDNFPAVEFFICASKLFNAKVGNSKVTTSTSSLVTFLLDTGLATVDANDKLEMVDDAFRATLTFLRNSDKTDHAIKPNLSALKQARTSNTDDEVTELFVKHFEVQFINVCDIPKKERDYVSKLLRHYDFPALDSEWI